MDVAERATPLFIDAFSGCGGLSLGLLKAGWRGLFAIERDKFAFNTFAANLLNGRFSDKFDWPEWLPKSSACIDALLEDHAHNLLQLRGRVTLLAGGPPCQGFSSAGRRDVDDPRNAMMDAYLKLVRILEPSIVLLENVRGITVDFNAKDEKDNRVNYAERLRSRLEPEYHITSSMVNAADFGVPQARNRFILIGIRKGGKLSNTNILAHIESTRRQFLRRHHLVVPVSAEAALSDLEVSRNGTFPSPDTVGFLATKYKDARTKFQHLMRDGCDGAPADMRLARHRPEISARFESIIARCKAEGRLNTNVGRDIREEYGLRKQALRVLDPTRPAPTITSMPDDLLHYSEPRTLTVRENARLQSFPDWYAFQGKYTSGGDRRKREVPRFTQVANAVPPLLAAVIGESLLELWRQRTSLIHLDVHENCDVREIDAMLDELAT